MEPARPVPALRFVLVGTVVLAAKRNLAAYIGAARPLNVKVECFTANVTEGQIDHVT